MTSSRVRWKWILIGFFLALRIFSTPSYSQESFSVIVLPDTQHYSDSYPEIFTAQTQWVVDNIDNLNIVYLAHEGDIVNAGVSVRQWENADTSMSLLEDPTTTGFADGLSYGVVPGNHDHPTDNYNDYFGVTRFLGRNYYGGHYGSTNDNNYTFFSAGGLDFLVVGLDYQPTSEVLDWADNLLKTHPDHLAIVVSHHILDGNGNFGEPGQAIYEALKDNPNLFLMLCGHRHAQARRTDTYQGHIVYSLLADYQSEPNGGNGWLRRLEFLPANDQIRVTTYSPTLDRYDTDSANQFVLNYDFGLEPTPTPNPACPADVSGDQTINSDDFKQILGLWGQDCSGCREDIEEDDRVNSFDLGRVILGWGMNCS